MTDQAYYFSEFYNNSTASLTKAFKVSGLLIVSTISLMVYVSKSTNIPVTLEAF